MLYSIEDQETYPSGNIPTSRPVKTTWCAPGAQCTGLAGVGLGARADMLALGGPRSVGAEGWASVICDNVSNNKLTRCYQISVSDNKISICRCENKISSRITKNQTRAAHVGLCPFLGRAQKERSYQWEWSRGCWGGQIWTWDGPLLVRCRMREWNEKRNSGGGGYLYSQRKPHILQSSCSTWRRSKNNRKSAMSSEFKSEFKLCHLWRILVLISVPQEAMLWGEYSIENSEYRTSRIDSHLMGTTLVVFLFVNSKRVFYYQWDVYEGAGSNSSPFHWVFLVSGPRMHSHWRQLDSDLCLHYTWRHVVKKFAIT